MAKFDWGRLDIDHRDIAQDYLHGLRDPDLVIAPDGNPYLYRWFIAKHFAPTPSMGSSGGTYFHIQVASDPERPLHNHPWDNMSVILAGMYIEQLQVAPPRGITLSLPRIAGDVIFRRASEAHRLILPDNVPYTITQFSFGPKINNWGFWYPEGFRDYRQVTRVEGNVSVHVKDSDAQQRAIPGCCRLCGAPDTGSKVARCLSNPTGEGGPYPGIRYGLHDFTKGDSK